MHAAALCVSFASGQGVQVQDEPAGGYGYLEEQERRRGRPGIATLVGAAALLLLIAVPVGPPGRVPANPEEAMAYMAGELFAAAAISAGIVWCIAYAVSLRFASRNWKIASRAARPGAPPPMNSRSPTSRKERSDA